MAVVSVCTRTLARIGNVSSSGSSKDARSKESGGKFEKEEEGETAVALGERERRRGPYERIRKVGREEGPSRVIVVKRRTYLPILLVTLVLDSWHNTTHYSGIPSSEAY